MLKNIQGLSDSEVLKNREKYGSNKISHIKKDSFIKQFFITLGDPIIRILLIALGIKLVFLIKEFDWYETVGIVIAIFLASFISTISEYGSEKAFEKLQEESSKIKCRVKRNGKIIEVNIDDIVVDDIVVLESGDKVPADGIVISGKVSIDESSLNGEAKEAHKVAVKDTINDENKVYRSSVVCADYALVRITSVGDKTIYGKLAKEIQEAQPDSPLKIKLTNLAKVISRIGYVGAFFVSVSYLFSKIIIDNGFDIQRIIETLSNFPLMTSYILHALTLSVTIIVVAVPEGLPMMITLVLSSNMKRMLKNNVLVRKLVGIETAGSINILFTDKTGTITKGKLEVVGIQTGDLSSFISEVELDNYPKYSELMKVSCFYNNASSFDENDNPIGGNITDKAVLKFLNNKPNHYDIVKSIPFDSTNKYSLATIKYDNKNLNLIKGAPEVIIKNCSSYYTLNGEKKIFLKKDEINRIVNNMTNQGIRVLAMATSDKQVNERDFRDLTFLGLIYIKDEIRKESIEAISLINKAHIQTVMITGDNILTATSIGREIGLLLNEEDIVMTSNDLNKMNDEEVKKIIPKLKIVARSLPQDKSRLIRISQELDYVVGMTGDGVNDAPALKKADVGFSMGSGTEVAKEASDIVILDDNILSISKAILFGRTIFKSIRKFIIFQLTLNLCAISLSIIGPFIGIDTPVTVIQMLWINMVMDTLAGLAFSFEAPLPEYMYEYPKKKNDNIINSYMFGQIIFTGLYSSILCVLFLKLPIIHNIFREGIDDKYLMTAFFGLFIFIGIFNSFNARTHRLNLFAHLFKNKIFLIVITFILIVQLFLIYYGGSLFRTAGLTLFELQIMILISLTVVPVDWFRKLYLRKKGIIGGV